MTSISFFFVKYNRQLDYVSLGFMLTYLELAVFFMYVI